MKTITLSSKNQVVIPTQARRKLGLKSGDRLVIEQLTESQLILKKEPSYSQLIGTLPAGPVDAVTRVRSLRDDWR